MGDALKEAIYGAGYCRGVSEAISRVAAFARESGDANVKQVCININNALLNNMSAIPSYAETMAKHGEKK